MSVSKTFIGNANERFTPEGGKAVRLINKTGAASVKGTCVTVHDTVDKAVQKVPINEPDCFGVIYDDGIPDGSELWVVVSGIADVLFSNTPIREYLARTPLTADGGTSGQALAEAIPTPPFTSDKHFCEIGHILETKAAPGLAKVNLHFN